MKREFYRIVTPGTFSNENFETLEEAKSGLLDFGSTPENKEYYQYWQERMKQCKIVKVTEIVEEVNVC